eukprot:5205886-Lingulodinium_polyedra.AAC.1
MAVAAASFMSPARSCTTCTNYAGAVQRKSCLEFPSGPQSRKVPRIGWNANPDTMAQNCANGPPDSARSGFKK